MSEKEKPLTYGQFVEFYEKVMDPRFQRLENRLTGLENEVQALKSEMHDRFDDLYKKFESLEQEYTVVKHQMKERDIAWDDIQTLKQKVKDLSDQIEMLERKFSEH